MARRKERPKFEHKAGTLEYFHCLQSMSKWSELLYSIKNDKPYNDFLLLLLENDFYYSESGIKINKVAQLSGFPTAKVTKWLKEIYDDIFILNEEHPELFCNPQEIKVSLLCSYFDSYGNFTLSLPAIPRKGETFMFHFMKALVGTDYFFVESVSYEIEANTTSINIFLKGGVHSEYRDFALSKARFEGRIRYMDEVDLLDSQIDDLLRGKTHHQVLNE